MFLLPFFVSSLMLPKKLRLELIGVSAGCDIYDFQDRLLSWRTLGSTLIISPSQGAARIDHLHD
jgi:hypothetical protein